MALGLLALLILVAGTGFGYWRDTRFPARSVWLRGTPVELRVQDGVSRAELGRIRMGVRLTDRFMARNLGARVRRHVEARIARSNGCRPSQKAGEAMIGEAQAGFMCMDTSSPAWQWMMLRDRDGATEAVGHELVHVLQGELGCLPNDAHRHYRWIIEGMAEEVSWQSLVAAHRATEARVMRQIRGDGALDPNLEPLRAYEHDGGRDPEYALWHLAVRRLLVEAASRGLAPANRPELALRHFCVRVGAGAWWRTAFARSFGLPVDDFYAQFERTRRASAARFGG